MSTGLGSRATSKERLLAKFLRHRHRYRYVVKASSEVGRNMTSFEIKQRSLYVRAAPLAGALLFNEGGEGDGASAVKRSEVAS